ncbi:MAG: hypothetical protein JSS95_10200 [Acidobacteria bacterium]|nr:hypothetical protein [Acidobacteriota bacterium]
MPIIPSGKYQLKSLHEEIALFDRKLAHTQSFESFSNDEERSAAVAKLTSKRSLLVRKAQQMVDEGIEFNKSERPKSLRPEDKIVAAKKAALVTTVADAATEELPAAEPEDVPSPFDGTSLDYRTDLDAYRLRSKSKASHA